MRPVILANFATVVGGGEVGLDLLADGLRRAGLSPIILTPGRGPVGDRFDRRVIPTAMDQAPLAIRTHATDGDLVHTMGTAGMVAALLARTGKPLIFHALIDRPEPLDAVLAEVADVVVCNSEATARRFPGAHCLEVVHNGVPEPAPATRTLGLDVERRHIGVIGRMAWWKGQLDLLPAAETILARRADVDFVFAGRTDGPVGEAVAEAGRRWPGRIIVLGWVPKIRNHLHELDVIVVPAVVEGFGRVAVEALRSGVPVVARRAGGLPEVLAGVSDPWLPDDRDDWAGKILAALDEPPDTPERLSALGARFDVERYVTRMLSIYRRLATSANAVGGDAEAAATGAAAARDLLEL